MPATITLTDTEASCLVGLLIDELDNHLGMLSHPEDLALESDPEGLTSELQEEVEVMRVVIRQLTA